MKIVYGDETFLDRALLPTCFSPFLSTASTMVKSKKIKDGKGVKGTKRRRRAVAAPSNKSPSPPADEKKSTVTQSVEVWLSQIEPHCRSTATSSPSMAKRRPESGVQPLLRRSPRFQPTVAPSPSVSIPERLTIPGPSTTHSSNCDPAFREILRRNRIHFDNIRLCLPPPLLSRIIQIADLQADPEHWKTTDAMKQIDRITDAEECTISNELRTILFPNLRDLIVKSGRCNIAPLMSAGNMLIDWNPALEALDILKIRPDEFFGYTAEALFPKKSTRDYVLQHPNLVRLIKPATAEIYCPFFTVEYKSQSRGGTFWRAANQNAISATSFVNVVQQLYSTLGKNSPLDSPVFSLTIDGTSASLYLHWCNKSSGEGPGEDPGDYPEVPFGEPDEEEEPKARYMSSIMANYHWMFDADIRACQRAIRGILEYGATERLGTLRMLLNEIAETL